MTDKVPAGAGNFAELAILEKGIAILCENDPDAGGLIAPRCKEIIALLCAYITEIESRNPAYGLVGTSDRRELITRHILDSLAPLGIFCRLLRECSPHADSRPRIADVGSGAGLPGIPLAIALPGADFTLIERMGRRAGFLRDTHKALNLANVAVAEAEMEKFAHNAIVKKPDAARAAADNFPLVTFRAFRQFEKKIVKGLLRLCAGGGVIAAYKGRRTKIEEDIAMLESYFAAGKSNHQTARYEIIPCPTPLLAEERHILLIRVQ